MSVPDADQIVLTPGSPEWQRELTASKIPALLGLSVWDSPFSLWFKMKGAVLDAPSTPQQDRGHYLEPAVTKWLADQYDLSLFPGQCWRNRDRPWQVASPDRIVAKGGVPYREGHPKNPIKAVVEVKTANDWERWGPDGSDEVPPAVRAQVVWQCDTLGVPLGYVGVLLPYLEFRGYTIRPAEGEAEYIRERAKAFLDSLSADEPPDVDDHTATWDTLRSLHPDIHGDVEVSPDIAVNYARSVLALREAETEHVLRRNQLAEQMGFARRGLVGSVAVAYRQPGPTGIPYVKAGGNRVLRVIAEAE